MPPGLLTVVVRRLELSSSPGAQKLGPRWTWEVHKNERTKETASEPDFQSLEMEQIQPATQRSSIFYLQHDTLARLLPSFLSLLSRTLPLPRAAQTPLDFVHQVRIWRQDER